MSMSPTPFLKSLSAKLDSFAAWHGARLDRPFLRPILRGRMAIAVILSFLIVAVSANILVRDQQYRSWQAQEATHSLDGVMMFSTTDASYFLGAARVFGDGDTFNEFMAKRHFPNAARAAEVEPYDNRSREFPLLSVVISNLAEHNTIRALSDTAHWLILVTAGLTAIAIAFAFGATGYWLEGCVAAIGGGLSTSYLVRSSAGRIDTDQLTLGFIYLLLGLSVMVARAKDWRLCLALCLGMSGFAYLFMWWYDRPPFVILIALSLAWLIMVIRRNVFLALAAPLMVLGISGVTPFNPLDSAYLQTSILEGGFIFPNTYETITEISKVPLATLLTQTSGSVEMGVIGVLGLGLWAIRHPVLAIAYGPVAVFGLLNFVVGNRAIFYSAPMLWFGVAFLVASLCRFIAKQLKPAAATAGHQTGAAVAAALVSGLMAFGAAATDYIPRQSFPKDVVAGFASLKNADGVVATWWDYGYVSPFFNDLPTLHDGGSQTTPVTHFVARALLEENQETSVGILKLLSDGGMAEISKHRFKADMDDAFEAAKDIPGPDIFVVATGQMARWMGSISKIGNWDIETGKPVSLRNNPDGPKVDYRRLNCRLKDYPSSLSCQGVDIDLQRGLIRGRPLLIGWTQTRDGEILRRRDFDHDADHAVQIVQEGNRLTVYFLHRRLYESTFNKLFHQGLVEHPAISLHYDDFPHIRIYRINGNPDG